MAKDGIKSIIIGPRRIGGQPMPDNIPIEIENHIADLGKEIDSLRTQLTEAQGEVERLRKSRKRTYRAMLGCPTCKKAFTIQEALGQSERDNPLVVDLEAQLAAHRWIPVAEKLPKDNFDVLVLDFARIFHIGNYEKDGWHLAGYNDVGQKGITHWKSVILPTGDSHE